MQSFCISSIVLLAVQAAFAHPPTGIVVDQKGVVYFTDLETVWKLDTDGKLSILRPGISGRHVHELALNKDGNLLGADLSYEAEKWISDVWQMSPAGGFTYLLKPTSNPPRGMSMWTDAAANMYLVEQDNHAKKQTLLLRRTPNGQVLTLAGSVYGHQDGKGTAARFESVGGMFIDNGDTIYLTDGTSVRRVTSDGLVTTIATDLTKRSDADRPPLFGKNDGILAGLSVDANNNIYLADAGNQRLLKISSTGLTSVVYRGDSPYYPNGVATSPAGDLFVLEVGFRPPSTWLPARVRKITASGQSSIVAVSGEPDQRGGGGFSQLRKTTLPGTVTRIAGLLIFVAVAVTIGVWKLTREQKHS